MTYGVVVLPRWPLKCDPVIVCPAMQQFPFFEAGKVHLVDALPIVVCAHFRRAAIPVLLSVRMVLASSAKIRNMF